MKLEPPPHLQALLDAYVEVTGLPVSLSYERAFALTQLHDRGMTADDVRAVVGKLKRLVAAGTKGYGDSSLDFRNAMGNVDTFEERALKIRQERLHKRGAGPKAEVAQTRELPDGSKVTVLAPARAQTAVPRADAQQALRKIADEIGTRGQGDKETGRSA